MPSLIAHSSVNMQGCTRADRPPILRVAPGGAVFCGHCGENMCPPDGHVTFMDIVCVGDSVEWRQRELDAVVHRCGRSLVAESAQAMLVELTSLTR